MNRKLLLCTLLLGYDVNPGCNKRRLSRDGFGAKGDGKTDDTSAFQRALDAVGKAGGGIVYAPCGNFFFARHLNVPTE